MEKPIKVEQFERACSDVYVAIVAIPPDFDITLYMSPGEQAGFFAYEGALTDQIKLIAEGVRNTPILKLTGVKFRHDSIHQFIQIIKDVGLMVDGIAFQAEINHFLIDMYKKMINLFNKKELKSSGITQNNLEYSINNMKTIDSFVIVNLFPFHLKDSLRPYIEKVVKIEDWRKK